jgi:uncharacterized protein (DUF58 family)
MTWPFRPRPESLTRQPLLDAVELEALRRAACSADLPPLQRLVRQPQLGERPSLIRGSGLDYDESRPFLPGDDRRHINWRLYARTGDLHLKLFCEERRPQLMLLLDRRQAMRMGSRHCLKLVQAARLAVLLALMARGEEMAVGAICLESGGTFHTGRSGEAALANLIHALTAPAPPMAADGEPGLAVALAQLQDRLPAGSLVCLISDFADLREADGALLWQLVREHDVAAFHISDPMEHELPVSGRLRLAVGEGGPLALDCDDAGLREAYASRMRERHRAIEDRLVEAGVRYSAVRTDQDVLALMGGEGGDGQ